MAFNSSLNSTDSGVFYAEQSSNDQSVPTPNTPIVFNSTEISGDDTQEIISISSIASPQPHIVTIDDDSNQPTMPYGFRRQLPIVPPSPNDLNLLPNSFIILAAMALANDNEDANINNYSPESSDPSVPFSISTPPMNVSAYNSLETSYTTTDDATFHSSDDPRRIYFLPLSPSPPPSAPRRQKRRLSLGMSFAKEGGVSQHICEACGQTILSPKDTPGPTSRS